MLRAAETALGNVAHLPGPYAGAAGAGAAAPISPSSTGTPTRELSGLIIDKLPLNMLASR